MTDLLAEVVHNGLPVAAFPIHEHWIDIGKTEDLRRAQETFSHSDTAIEKAD